jgi:hypothetical protein
MAAPTYTHDLTDWILDSDTTAWTELTGKLSGGAPDEADTESALQGTNTVSQATNTTSECTMIRVLASPVTLTTGQVFLVWHGHGVATALDSYANGGLRLYVCGSTAGDFKGWKVGGNDVPPFPYGKWVNNPVDPTVTNDGTGYTGGTPPTGGTSIYGVGSGCILTKNVAKGQPHVVDMIRYGRAQSIIYGGDITNGYGTFNGYALVNDASTARWGLIQKADGGYLWKGLMSLGTSSNSVDFRDSNVNIFIQDTRKVTSSFNKIEITHASSRVDWTNINFVCLSPSTTASKGDFEMINSADLNIEGCTFTDMNTFIFLSSAAINTSTFRRCAQITGGGAAFDTCIFDKSTAATTLVLTNLNQVTDCTFTSDGGNHAIDLGTISSSTSMNWNNYLTGYVTGSAGDPASSSSTGNEAIKVNVASGQKLTINVGSGYSIPSIYNTGTGTVAVVSGQVTTSVTVKDISTGSNIQSARVLVWATNNANKFYNASVTITGSGTTATVSHTGHGLVTGDYVIISGVTNDDDYNGVFQITKINDNSYSYTADDTLTSPASGTILAKWAILSGTTDSNGYIEDVRSFSANQPVTGWVRKSSGSPYYQQGVVTGTITTGGGFSQTIQLIRDE